MKYIFLFLIFVFQSQLSSASDNPTQTIKNMVELISKNMVSDETMRGVASLDKKMYEEYRNTNKQFHRDVSRFIDFETLGSYSMPKKWKKKYWSGSEKKKFLSLLQELIEEIVYPKGKDFFSEVKSEYSKPSYSEDGKTASVFCTVPVKNKKAEIQYKLIKKGGTWKIYDVNLEGEWWTDSFKSQFNHIITTKSYPDLIQAMQKKLNNVKAGTSF